MHSIYFSSSIFTTFFSRNHRSPPETYISKVTSRCESINPINQMSARIQGLPDITSQRTEYQVPGATYLHRIFITGKRAVHSSNSSSSITTMSWIWFELPFPGWLGKHRRLPSILQAENTGGICGSTRMSLKPPPGSRLYVRGQCTRLSPNRRRCLSQL